ncbi:MAG: phospholipase C, phosphocholine-specific [Spirosomataceae bacterium]
MDSRRDFLKKAALLSGGASLWGSLPDSIQKALEINPAQGSTYLDAEHIVVLMQENRSFDHCFGTLRGVRGYNDPRAITLPNKNLVWLQKNAAGETYAPFRLDIKDTKATWMSALPHSWENQVDARNDGKYDRWLDVKKSGNKEYAPMPLTMGYYTREDIPFYYAMADAFTVCDQHFCSSLTGTTPNRLYLWTGTIREKPSIESKANVRNSDVDYDDEARWTTFPERLEDNNISWRIYQNELSLPMGFKDEEEDWLANFTDNPIEWFTQYHVRFSPGFQKFLATQEKELPTEIAALEQKLKSLPEAGKETELTQKLLKGKKDSLALVKQEREKWSPENFEKLSQREKNLHRKAFTTNINDPHYHELTKLRYKEGDTEREVAIPKGDILHQFREDVNTGKLPAISWVVAPSNFSDHPGSPWYGAWYISEVMDILTKNPEVWKKTIFIVTYDENDGYFDHVPPFVAPKPDLSDGLVSKGIDPSVEHVTQAQEDKRKEASPQNKGRAGSIGLGYRVPMLIASPWSRGGYVNSQVFDHTSVLQFMEHFLSHKTKKKIEETNISAWRRTVCGDLTSTFRPYNGEAIQLPAFVEKEAFIQSVHQAKFKKVPANFKKLSTDEIARINQDPASSPLMPQQEKGIRPASPLPYQLYTEGRLTDDKKGFQISLSAQNDVFGRNAAGAPFHVYAPGKYRNGKNAAFDDLKAWSYAVSPGDTLTDIRPLENFENDVYHLCVYGPNGYFRKFTGNAGDPPMSVQCDYQRTGSQSKQLTGNVEFRLRNTDINRKLKVTITDNAYKKGEQTRVLDISSHKGSMLTVTLDLKASFGWYDFSVRVEGFEQYEQRFAGRVETGKPSFSDPFMGRGEV